MINLNNSQSMKVVLPYILRLELSGLCVQKEINSISIVRRKKE